MVHLDRAVQLAAESPYPYLLEPGLVLARLLHLEPEPLLRPELGAGAAPAGGGLVASPGAAGVGGGVGGSSGPLFMTMK